MPLIDFRAEEITLLANRLLTEIKRESSPLTLLSCREISETYHLQAPLIRKLWEMKKIPYYLKGAKNSKVSFRTDVEEFLLRVKNGEETLVFSSDDEIMTEDEFRLSKKIDKRLNLLIQKGKIK